MCIRDSFKGDGTLGGEGAEVGFRCVGGAEAEGGADLGPGGGAAFLLDGVADELQDLLLTGGECCLLYTSRCV